jgi:hypothetical protein
MESNTMSLYLAALSGSGFSFSLPAPNRAGYNLNAPIGAKADKAENRSYIYYLIKMKCRI